MKKIFLSFLFGLSVAGVTAQVPEVDSLKKILSGTNEDTIKVMVLARLSYYDQSFENGLQLAHQALSLAKKINYEKGEAACLQQIGNQYLSISNYAVALHYYLESLKIRERIADFSGMASLYKSIGIINKEQGDYKNAINWYRKAIDLMPDDNYRLALLKANFGDVFILLDKPDSALKYFQSSYEHFNLSSDKYQLVNTLNGLGNVQATIGNAELALGYYRLGIPNAVLYNDTVGLSNTYLLMAKFFNKNSRQDSSIFYAGRSLLIAQGARVQQMVIGAAKLLSQLYQNKNDKEALRYLNIAVAAKDSVFSREKTTTVQNMLEEEKERQTAIIEIENKATQQHRLHLQYASLAFGIIIFIMLFLLLTHSFITSPALIEFLGVLALLVVFEFFNLLLHPFLEKVTHHSPLLMLLALVWIGALLVPLHHKLEQWARGRFVQKNKKIRLEAAKKTIRLLSDDDEKK